MYRLALANLLHRKVRTGLSVLAVAIAVTLLLVLVGLSHGTLHEISDRMESVDAEIIVRDSHFDLGSMGGGKLWEKEIARFTRIEVAGKPAIKRVIPVFLGRMKLGGLSQNVFGICPEDFPAFAGSRRLLEGVVFDDIADPAAAIIPLDQQTDLSPDPLPLIIDRRLSRAADVDVGQAAQYGNAPAVVVGIVETGVAGRVFAPINRLRAVNGVAAHTAHMFFIKARPGLSTNQLRTLSTEIEAQTQRSATLVANYGQVLAENFRNLTIFVNLVSVIALVICFLFILVTMYTMVLEQRRDMAIIHSLGASPTLILRQTLLEAILICLCGSVVGMALAAGGRWLIQTHQPLMTVDMRPEWLAGALAVGLVGGILSALYPGVIALRQDPVEALGYE